MNPKDRAQRIVALDAIENQAQKLAESGADAIDVIVHCYGAITFMMAMLAGLGEQLGMLLPGIRRLRGHAARGQAFAHGLPELTLRIVDSSFRDALTHLLVLASAQPLERRKFLRRAPLLCANDNVKGLLAVEVFSDVPHVRVEV